MDKSCAIHFLIDFEYAFKIEIFGQFKGGQRRYKRVEFSRTNHIKITQFSKLNNLKYSEDLSQTIMDQNTLIPITEPIAEQQQPQANNHLTTQQRLVSNQQKVTKLKLVSKTWTKDSYGLFDYQAKDEQYERKENYIEETMFVVRNNKTCQTELVKDLSEVKFFQGKNSEETQRHMCPFVTAKEEFTVLGELIVDKTKKLPSFKLKLHKTTEEAPKSGSQIPSRHSNHSKKLIPFILADSNGPKNHGLPLQPGNIIKFGRVEYLVLESFNGKNTQSYRDSAYLQQGDGQQVFDVLMKRELKSKVTGQGTEVEKDNIYCKICLCNEETVEDPMISPCNCKGYCGYIHTNCLRQWINNKVKKENLGLTASYNFTKFQCQICKSPFPKIIRTQVQQVQMMKIDKPQKPYIMLQSLDPSVNSPLHQSSSGEKEKLLHVITTDEKSSIKIGRANECEIRLTDISVSRRHAEIKLVDGDFYIKDTGAKFGTLVEWNRVGSNKADIITINRKKNLKIQLGRTSYQFSVQDISQDIDTE